MSAIATPRLLVVTHTHWDREWYHPAARFRQRLVALIDALLDARVTMPSVLLDGQAIVLEDYLAVCPDATDALSSALATGRIEAGPWYVLADLLIPRGESLIRNLFAGRRVLARLGATPPPVWYAPDAFGHPQHVPTIAEGFGIPLVILWRGHGGAADPPDDLVRWRARDGASVLVHHLPPDGYEFGSTLPIASGEVVRRAERIRATLGPRATSGVTLLTVGADHHAIDPQLPEALAALGDAMHQHGWALQAVGLREAVHALVDAAPHHTRPLVTGERRDSYGYAWTLQGTFATRTSQKRRHQRLERRLLEEVEPLVACAWAGAGRARGTPRADGRVGAAALPALLDACWRDLLQCHPHDTLCGCSVDEVARAMDARLDAVATQLDGLEQAARDVMLGHDRVAARRRRDDWQPALVVVNGASRVRHGLAQLTLVRTIADEPVGPGSGVAPNGGPIIHAPPAALDGVGPVQWLQSDTARERLESPLHYPDNDLVQVDVGLAWIEEAVPAFGMRTRPIGDLSASAPPRVPPARGATTDALSVRLDNDRLSVSIDRDGISVSDVHGPWGAADWLSLVDQDDAGDCYTPAARGTPRRGRIDHVALTAAGPWRASARLVVDVPTGREGTTHRCTIDCSIDAGSDRLRLDVRGANHHDDHRLRLTFTLPELEERTFADAGFGAIERRPFVVPADRQDQEQVIQGAPMHRWIALPAAHDTAFVVVADGVPEIERAPDGAMCTLLRCTGELSRNTLPERRGHAGWPATTPAAQEHGPFEATVWVTRIDATPATVAARADALADECLRPLRAHTMRDAIGLASTVAPVALEGDGLAVLAVKPSEDRRALVARCIYLTATEQLGRWR
ncbi:MAG: hypothetical protein MUE41_17350, partial [Gemmatimonadaceae bacterium]|nr:hypothetical protein [Gemmatimonadaceae bacterium]